MTAFYMSRLAVPAAVLLATTAAWLSHATLALVTPGGPRVGLFPLSLAAGLTSASAMAAAIAVWRAGLSLTPCWLLGLLLLPWLPLPVPAAFLIWSGPIRWLIWFAVFVLVLAPIVPRVVQRARATMGGEFVAGRPRLTAGLLAFALFAWSAWQVSPSIPGGDEPHYLVITQSLLLDGDLKIENNHTRGDYQAYYAGRLAPHYIQRGRNGEIYSIHAPGLSALVAPAFAIGGYHGVVLFLIAVAACGSALAWHVGWAATRSVSAAWFGCAAVTVSATTIFHAFAVYPDGAAGVIVLTGIWALLRASDERRTGATRLTPWFLHGAALALLPWMHSRFALLAGSLGALVLLRLASTKNPAGKAVAFLSVPAVSAIAWVAYFLIVYGHMDPSAPYGINSSRDFSLGFVPGGLTGLLFDQRFGLIANAPVLLFGLVGLALMLGAPRTASPESRPFNFAQARPEPVEGRTPSLEFRRLSIELLFVMVPYLITSTSYAMWWAGSSAPARFASPAVLALSIPCAFAWQRMRHPASTIVAAGALACTAFLSFVLISIDGGRLAFNTRETTALWLAWAAQLNPLGEGMPVWYRGREGVFARDVVIWAVALAIAYVLARWLVSWSVVRSRVRYATVIAAIFVGMASVALTIVWTLGGVEPIAAAPAQLDVLRRLAREPRVIAAQVAPPRAIDSADLLSRLRIEASPRPFAGTGSGRSEQPIVSFPAIPAGRYRLLPRTRAPGGWLILGIAQDQFALRSEPLSYPPTPIDIDFPVDVRAIVVRGDEEARRAIRSVALESAGLVPIGERLTNEVARRAVTYDLAYVFFLDQACFPEPDAFWVGGSRHASFVLQPRQPGTSVPMVVRNAPVDNRVTVESGQWREDLTLAPGEERRLQVPIAPGRAAALVTVTTSSGFRPSESLPDSRDERFLGVWMKIAN